MQLGICHTYTARDMAYIYNYGGTYTARDMSYIYS